MGLPAHLSPSPEKGVLKAARRWAILLTVPGVAWAQGQSNPDSSKTAWASLGLSPFMSAPGAVTQYTNPTLCVAATMREEQRADRTVAAQNECLSSGRTHWRWPPRPFTDRTDV